MFLVFQVLTETLGIQPGDAGLFINGLHVDLDVHNPFRWDSLENVAGLLSCSVGFSSYRYFSELNFSQVLVAKMTSLRESTHRNALLLNDEF